MKKGWETVELGDACRFIDYRGKTPEKTESGLRLITAKNVKMGFLQREPVEYVDPSTYDSWMTRGIPKKGDVLFTTEAPLANVTQLDTDEKVVFAQRIIVLQPSGKNIDRTFLKYLLLSDSAQERIRNQGTGATVQGIKASLLKAIEISYPPLAEQQRIVGLLDEAFEGIATAKANAEKNLQNARALFESHLQSVFSQRGKGWVEEQLDALTVAATPITYGVVKPGDEGDVRFVRGGDLVRGKVRLTQLRTIAKAVSDQYRRTLLKGGELLICLVGQPGQVAVAPQELAGANIARQVGLIRLKSIVDAEFVRYFLQSAPGAEALGARESGSVQQVINLGELRQVQVPYPPLAQQREIVARLEGMEVETQRLITLYTRKLAALEALKKSLLHQAFSGEL